MAHDRHLGGPFRLRSFVRSRQQRTTRCILLGFARESVGRSILMYVPVLRPRSDVSYGGSSNATSSNQPGTLFLFPSLAARIAALRLLFFLTSLPVCLRPLSTGQRAFFPAFVSLSEGELCRTVYFNFQVHNPLPEALLRPAPTPAGWGPTGGVCQSQSQWISTVSSCGNSVSTRNGSLECLSEEPKHKPLCTVLVIMDGTDTREVPDVTKDGGPVHGQRRHTDSAATLIPGMVSPDQPSWAIDVHVVSSGAACCLGTLAEGRPYRCDAVPDVVPGLVVIRPG
jgi:hypothetical protein